MNGNVTSTSSITFTYILMANNAGEYTIPGASIIADGDQMVSNSVKIKVLPQDQGGNSVGEQVVSLCLHPDEINGKQHRAIQKSLFVNVFI